MRHGTPADVATIDIDLRQLLPVTDDIIGRPAQRRDGARLRSTESQSRTRRIIIWVGCAAVLIGLGFSWLDRAQHHASAQRARRRDDATRGRRHVGAHSCDACASDEIGAMARTVIVFRDTMLERERLTAEQSGDRPCARAARRRDCVDHRAFATRWSRRSASCARPRSGSKISATKLNGAADAVSAEARTAENAASTRPPATSPPRRARWRNWRPRSARSRTRPPSRPKSPAAQSQKPRRTVKTMTDLGERRHTDRRGDRPHPGDRRRRPICWRSTPPSKRRAPARPGRGFAVVAVRGQVARRSDRQRDRGDRRTDRRHPVRRRRRGAGDRAGQRHHPGHVGDRLDRFGHSRGAEPRRSRPSPTASTAPRWRRRAAPRP